MKMRILYQWIGDGSQRIRENYNASDSRSLHITGAGAGENYLRRAVAFGVCLHERLLYPGYDGSKVLRPGRNCAV